MVEKIGTIKNPLTIIAIFAAIAEISGTLVLPFLSEENQGVFIWFTMSFPLLLVLLFFLTLNFNRKVLYAPSDFKDEDNYLRSFQPASPNEVKEKLKEQVIEAETEAEAETDIASTVEKSSKTSNVFINNIPVTTTLRVGSSLAEDLVLNKISREFKYPMRRNMRLDNSTGKAMVFDGVIFSNDIVTIIEVKYAPNLNSISLNFGQLIKKFTMNVEQYYGDKKKLSLIIAIVTESQSKDNFKDIRNELYKIMGVTPFKVEVRIYSMTELITELNN